MAGKRISLKWLGIGLNLSENGAQKAFLALLGQSPVAVGLQVNKAHQKTANLYTGFVNLMATEGLEMLAMIKGNLALINDNLGHQNHTAGHQGFAQGFQGSDVGNQGSDMRFGPGNGGHRGLGNPGNQGHDIRDSDRKSGPSKLNYRGFEVLFKGYDTYLKSVQSVAGHFKELEAQLSKSQETTVLSSEGKAVTININNQANHTNQAYITSADAIKMINERPSKDIPTSIEEQGLLELHGLHDCPPILAREGSETAMIKIKKPEEGYLLKAFEDIEDIGME